MLTSEFELLKMLGLTKTWGEIIPVIYLFFFNNIDSILERSFLVPKVYRIFALSFRVLHSSPFELIIFNYRLNFVGWKPPAMRVEETNLSNYNFVCYFVTFSQFKHTSPHYFSQELHTFSSEHNRQFRLDLLYFVLMPIRNKYRYLHHKVSCHQV